MSTGAAAIALRLYRALARTFPGEVQNVYGDELLHTAEDAVDFVWRRYGVFGLCRLLLDIAIRVPAEYLSEMKRDVRVALRMLLGSPGFAAVALVSLSMGIGVATSAYSEMEGLLRDLPGVRQPDELITLQKPVSFPAYRRFRQLGDLFSEAAAYVAPVPLGASTGGPTERYWAHLVTPSYFSTLAVQPLLGRFFDTAHEQPGQAPAAVISYRFWRDRLASDRSAVGKTVRVNGHACTIVGVGREDFAGASPALFPVDFWLPATTGAHVVPELADGALERPERTMFQFIARLGPGVDAIGTVTREIAAVDSRITPFHARSMAGHIEQFMSMLKAASWTYGVMGLFGLVLASVGLAGVTAYSVARRGHEIGIRMALGAQKRDVLTLVMKEGAVLIALGSAAGLVLAVAGIRALSGLFFTVATVSAYDPVLLRWSLCWRVTFRPAGRHRSIRRQLYGGVIACCGRACGAAQ